MVARTHLIQPSEALKCHIERVEQLNMPSTVYKAQPDVISKAFWDGMPTWIEDPVMKEWRGPKAKTIQAVLKQVNTLYHAWDTTPGPFNTTSDPLWTSTVATLREVGLPLYNNNINLPDALDDSWPFHFKALEHSAVIAKGSRVEQPDACGYVCNPHEANLYGIRALQQELRAQAPTRQPLLLASRFDHGLLKSVAQSLGLECILLPPDWPSTIQHLLEPFCALRPIIFAATLSSSTGQCDDFDAIRLLSVTRDVFLHVDAARNFDYLTSLSDAARIRLGLSKLILSHPRVVCNPTQEPGLILAGSIVAGGINDGRYGFVVALKPRATGADDAAQLVEYTRGRDCTISGSRDGLGPLLMGLQEHRFDEHARREIYGRCLRIRQQVSRALVTHTIRVSCPPESLDFIIHTPPSPRPWDVAILARLGLVPLKDGTLLGTVQPSVTSRDVRVLLGALGVNHWNERAAHAADFSATAPHPRRWELPRILRDSLESWVKEWRRQAADSAGYPFNQAPYSALGPVAAHFLDRHIPEEWLRKQAASLLKARKMAFGIRGDDADLLAQFGAFFTTGSTMGNQLGVQAALAYAPHNYIYCSASSHYSLAKALSDNDVLTHRWVAGPVPVPQFASIPVDSSGRMQVDALVRRAVEDRAACARSGRPFGVTLFVNVGTTFAGGRDDISALRRALREVGLDASYIHADGALDFGFGPRAEVCLGPPSTYITTCDDLDGIPVVQGITVSHHKAYGMMVSGEVIYYDPTGRALPHLPAESPRAVFEAWLFQQVYTPADLIELHHYCLQNANALRDALCAAGVFVLNEAQDRTSLVVVLERPAPWVTVDFHLRVEGDCAHYIAMPHITRRAVDRFATTVASLDGHYDLALRAAAQAFNTVFRQRASIRMVRIRPRASNFASIEAFISSTETCYSSSSTALCPRLESSHMKEYIHSAISIAILDSHGNPIAVLLAQGSGLDRRILMGPILTHRSVVCDVKHLWWRIAETTFYTISGMLRELSERPPNKELDDMYFVKAFNEKFQAVRNGS